MIDALKISKVQYFVDLNFVKRVNEKVPLLYENIPILI